MPKKSILKGTIILLVAGIIAKLLGFFFRIPIIYMIGEEGIGLYQLIYPLYTFLLALAGGIPVAISKMVSERVALNRYGDCRKIYRASIIFMTVLGTISSMLLMFFAHDIIRYFSWSKEAYYSILGISLAPFFTCILSVYRGYFQGFQNMTPTGVSQIIEQFGRVFVGVALTYILLPKGIGIAAGGAAFGATFGAAIAVLYFIVLFYKNTNTYKNNNTTISYINIFKELVVLSIPISLSQAISSIMTLIDSLTIPKLLKISGYTDSIATALYGQLTGKAFVLINVPLTMSIALAQSTVPAISEVYALKDKRQLKGNIETAFKIASVIAFPCTAGLYALARPIFNFVFQGMEDGWQLLQILSIAVIFIIFSQVATSILNGVGKTFLPLFAIVVGSIFKVIVSIRLVPNPNINIKGAAYGTLISYLIIAVIDIYFMIKYTNVYINVYKSFISPILCSATMIFIVILAYTKIYAYTLSINISTILSILIGILAYIILLSITKTVEINKKLQWIKNKR